MGASTDEIARYFDERAKTWDSIARVSPVQPAVVSIAGAGAGSRVLDAGCGTGIMVPYYLDAGVAEVVGIDLAPGMVERARMHFGAEANVSFCCGDMLSYRDEAGFDAVVIYNAYPHFLDRPGLVRAVYGLLRPQGRFVVAHGMGREALARHHASVPTGVSSMLEPAQREARWWSSRFSIDTLVDAPGFYCIAGQKD